MYKIYQIGMGEGLEDISKLFNVDINEIKKINGIKDNMTLTPGSFIIIPGSNNQVLNEDYIDYLVKTGDTMYGIAKKYNVDVDTLLKLNGLEENDYIYPNDKIQIPNSMNNMYITKKGDTIKTLEEKLNSSIDKISANNTIYLTEDQLIKLN